MKAVFCSVILIIFQLQACVVSNHRPPAEDYSSITYQSFYDELSPFGIWINYPGYGYVWVPRLEPGFRPYVSNGRWVYTINGWTWVSNYRWGWGPFHYGRWFLDTRYGWVWVPGNQWAPAWVTWGQSANYYGWAPLGPTMTTNVSVNTIPNDYWTFIPDQYITSPSSNYINNNKLFIHNITLINNINRDPIGQNREAIPYFKGPQIQDVERATGQKIRPVPIRDAAKPETIESGRDVITVYRPTINGTSNPNTRPARIEPMDPPTPVTRPNPRPSVEPPTTWPNPVTPTRPAPELETRPTPRPIPESPAAPVTHPSLPETRPTRTPGSQPTTRPSIGKPQSTEKPVQQTPSRRGPR